MMKCAGDYVLTVQKIKCYCVYDTQIILPKLKGSNNFEFYSNDATVMAESKEHLKNLLIKIERGEWKSWLKTQCSE